MKPWISVQNFVLACALIFLIALLKLTSSELASWVQAIGSIAAIWGALHVSSLQHRRQNAAQNALAINRAKARLAVVKNAAEYGMSTGLFAAKTPPVFVFISTWKMTLGVTTAAALNSLEALPSHELGTYEMVLACSGTLGGLVKMRADVNSFIEKGEISEESAALAYEGIQLQGRMIEMYWLQFQDSFSKEIAQLELSH